MSRELAYYTRNAAALDSRRAMHGGKPKNPSMTSKAKRDDPLPRGRRRRPPRLIAAGFIAAFVASIATVIYTGLLVTAPQRDDDAGIGVQESGVDVGRDDGNAIRADGLQADIGNGDPAAVGLDERDDMAVSNGDAAEHGDDLTGHDDTDGDPK